jgi:hypothetical protein
MITERGCKERKSWCRVCLQRTNKPRPWEAIGHDRTVRRNLRGEAFVQPLSQAGTCCSNTKRHSRKSAVHRRRRPPNRMKTFLRNLTHSTPNTMKPFLRRRNAHNFLLVGEAIPLRRCGGHSLRRRQGCGLGVSRGPFRLRACVAAAPDPTPAGRRHVATLSCSWQRTVKMPDRATLSCSLTQGISSIIIRNAPLCHGEARRKKGARHFAAKVVKMHRPAGADPIFFRRRRLWCFASVWLSCSRFFCPAEVCLSPHLPVVAPPLRRNPSASPS